jgi:hypothetical protein
LDHPGATLARAAILQYRPVNTDVLPIFVLLHLLFAPLLWLLLRLPNVTLGASLALYALVHVFGWTVPAWPNGHWAFNPLAWQLLVVLGAWWMLEEKRVWPWVTSRTVLGLAVLYLLFSLVIALSWRIKPLEALIPQTLAKLHQLDKSNLDPLRLLHFLAIAVLAAWFVPRNWRGLKTPVMRGAICCGQNSLPIYCLGVLLAFAGHMVLFDISDGLAMQIAASLVGIAAMIATAMLLNLISIKPRQQSAIDSTLPSENSRTIMSHSIGRDLADGRQRTRISHVKVEARIAAFETAQADEAEKAGSLFIAPGRPTVISGFAELASNSFRRVVQGDTAKRPAWRDPPGAPRQKSSARAGTSSRPHGSTRSHRGLPGSLGPRHCSQLL